MYIYPLAVVLTIFFHVTLENVKYYYDFLWSFSVWLEAFAIAPQLFIVYKKKEVEVITGSYMACLGVYKFFYVLNWIYMYIDKQSFVKIKFIAGIIQLALYFDFLYYYFISGKVTANRIKLPV